MDYFLSFRLIIRRYNDISNRTEALTFSKRFFENDNIVHNEQKPGVQIMSKGKDSKKAVKKVALLTPKEKKAAKAEKKAAKGRPGRIGE